MAWSSRASRLLASRLLTAALLVPGGVLAVRGVTSAQGSMPTARIFEALTLRSGDTVCEIGAGDGELSLAAADLVGAQGRVYSSELGADRIKTLRAKVEAANRPQIHVVAGDPAGTNFPDGACDGLFMRNVYHHFPAPAVMNLAISGALGPGGRLVVVDFAPSGAEAARPADRATDGSGDADTHGVAAETVARELKAAGFDVVGSETGAERRFLVVAVKPAR